MLELLRSVSYSAVFVGIMVTMAAEGPSRPIAASVGHHERSRSYPGSGG